MAGVIDSIAFDDPELEPESASGVPPEAGPSDVRLARSSSRLLVLDSTTGRQPMQPPGPMTRSRSVALRAMVHQDVALQSLQPSQEELVRHIHRRRIRRPTMAQMLVRAKDYSRTTDAHSHTLAERYALSDVERHEVRRIMQTMRYAQRRMAARILRHLPPPEADVEQIRAFLCWLGSYLRSVTRGLP